METARTEEAEQGLRVQSRFIIPSKGGTCFINGLPPELLSRILELGYIAHYAGDEDEEGDGDDTHDLNWSNNWNRLSDAEADPDSEEEREHVHEADEDEIDVDSDSDPVSGSSRCIHQFRVALSLVCRHWRNVAISTPSLWTDIQVQTNVRPPYDVPSKMLKRSQNLPLDILLNCDYNREDFLKPSVDDIRFLFTVFIPHIPRWRLMVVSVSDYRYMYEFLSVVSDPSVPPASRLTRLYLLNHEDTMNLGDFSYPNMSKHLTLFGGSAPLLTKLSLRGAHVDWDQPWIASASNLTSLRFAYHAEDIRPSWAQFATIMRSACCNLEVLDLCFSGPSGDPQEWFIAPTPGSSTDPNAPFQLLRVTYFLFACNSPELAIGLLRKFYLPAIKKLSLSLHEGGYTEFVRELAGPATSLSSEEDQPHSLLSRLEYLQIDTFDCGTEIIETLFGELQNLTSLGLQSRTASQSFCKILCTPCTLTGRPDVWLPRLDRLYVSFMSADVLREVVRWRMEAGVPLSILRAKNPYGLNDESEKWFEENTKAFMYIWNHEYRHFDDSEESDEEDDREDEDEGSDVD